MQKKPLSLIGPFNNLGYGIATYSIAKHLDALCDLHIHPIGQPEQSDKFIKEGMSRLWDYNAPCLRIFHQHSMKEFVGRGAHIGFPIFELDTFTDIEKHHLSGLDELFVCSQWALEVACNNGIHCPKTVIPLGVDTEIFNPTRSNPPKNKTVFLNVGKWEVRKGHPELAQAFHKTFKPGDPVELWLMCDNPFYDDGLTNQFEGMFLNGPMGGQVRFMPRVESHLQVAKIMGAATVGVFPSKAEGWNLELLEMMAMGKPVITTNYAAHTEFCNTDNACLLEPTGLESARDNIWFHGQGNWCVYDVDSLCEYMKEMHLANASGNLRTNQAGIDTGKKFTWDASARKINNVLCYLAKQST